MSGLFLADHDAYLTLKPKPNVSALYFWKV